MKRLLATLVLFHAVSSCSSSGERLGGQPTSVLNTVPPSNEPLPEPIIGPPPSQVAPQNLSPAARSAATKGVSEPSVGGLLDCVSQSCRVNCSPKLEKRVRPKWCANFKVPVEAAR